MNIIKYILIFITFIISCGIGNLYSKRYSNRELELKNIKNMLNVFKAKIKFNSVPIQDIFHDIYAENKNTIGEIFECANIKMQNLSADDAWNEALDEKIKYTNLKLADKLALENLGKMLGNTDIEGQVSQIELTETLIECQIQDAKDEKNKNIKLCKTLGIATGLTIAIVLI